MKTALRLKAYPDSNSGTSPLTNREEPGALAVEGRTVISSKVEDKGDHGMTTRGLELQARAEGEILLGLLLRTMSV